MKFLPWKEDRWLSKNGSIIVYDKLEHLAGSFILCTLIAWPFGPGWGAGAAMALGLLWELKDGFQPYDRKTGAIEGFSWKDLIADAAGVLLGLWVNYDILELIRF